MSRFSIPRISFTFPAFFFARFNSVAKVLYKISFIKLDFPLPERPATGYDTYAAYWLPDAQVAVMGRNDRAGYQVWSAADGYPGDGCFREFHKKDDKSGMNYWRITSPTTASGYFSTMSSNNT